MAEYRLSPRAQRDLDDIFDYSVIEWGLPQAIRYVDQIAVVCAEMAKTPLHAQNCDDIRPGYRRRGVGQHIIFFQPTVYGIAIIRILHRRMDSGRHL